MLQAAVADHKERALQADALKQALEVQAAAAAALQGSMQDDVGRLGLELQQASAGHYYSLCLGLNQGQLLCFSAQNTCSFWAGEGGPKSLRPMCWPLQEREQRLRAEQEVREARLELQGLRAATQVRGWARRLC